MSKDVNSKMVSEMVGRLSGVRDVVIIDQGGLDANSTCALRAGLRKSKVELAGGRANLVSVAVNNLWGGGFGQSLVGSVAIAWSGEDIVSLSKSIVGALKDYEKVKVIGGVAEGSFVDGDKVMLLSKSKGRGELLADVCGAVMAACGSVVRSIESVPGDVAGAIDTVGAGN